MEQTTSRDLEDELDQIDMDSIKFDAILQLKTWQKKMHTLVDRTYQNRLHEINSITTNRSNEIQESQDQLRRLKSTDQEALRQIKDDVRRLKSNIVVVESIPDHLQRRIERTVQLESTTFEDDDLEEIDDVEDDEPVVIDFDKNENDHCDRMSVVVAADPHQESRISRVFNSYPVQHTIAVNLAKAVANVGTIAATSTTTIAVTTMAKTAVIATVCGIGTVAYGVSKIAFGATQKAWSMVFSSDE